MRAMFTCFLSPLQTFFFLCRGRPSVFGQTSPLVCHWLSVSSTFPSCSPAPPPPPLLHHSSVVATRHLFLLLPRIQVFPLLLLLRQVLPGVASVPRRLAGERAWLTPHPPASCPSPRPPIQLLHPHPPRHPPHPASLPRVMQEAERAAGEEPLYDVMARRCFLCLVIPQSAPLKFPFVSGKRIASRDWEPTIFSHFNYFPIIVHAMNAGIWNNRVTI